MKATLEFDLTDPEHRYSYEIVIQAHKMSSAIDDLRQLMRKYRKYHEFKDEATEKFFDQLDDEIIAVFSDVKVD